MENSPRRVTGNRGRKKGWRQLRDLLDPDGAAWALIQKGEDRYDRRRTGNDSGPPPTSKG